jgi:hypothetical protein
MDFSDYIVYVDESGDHGLVNIDTQYPIFVLPNNSYKPITNTTWVRARLCTRLAAASNKAYQLLGHGWWFSPGTPLPNFIT